MIATTIEQSKALLEAGISPETADMSWRYYVLTYDFGHAMEVRVLEPVLYAYKTKEEDSIPAWSLGALWNLCKDQSIELCTADCTAEEVITILVTRLICAYENGKGDEENNIG